MPDSDGSGLGSDVVVKEEKVENTVHEVPVSPDIPDVTNVEPEEKVEGEKEDLGAESFFDDDEEFDFPPFDLGV